MDHQLHSSALLCLVGGGYSMFRRHWIWEIFTCRLGGVHSKMPVLVNLSLLKLNVRPVKPIPKRQPAITGVKLHVVIIMKFWREKQWKMVSGMIAHDLNN